MCHFFQSASHRDPPQLKWKLANLLPRSMCAVKICKTADVRIHNKYICLWLCVCESKFPFFHQTIYKNPSVWLLSLPISGCLTFRLSFSLSFFGATALILYFTAYLLRPCVYIQSSTRFLLTLGAELTSKNYSFSGQFCRTDHCLV